jgi:cytochrome oxidase Cu insertion factor (SCO1/SenC/PrrC family)
MARTSVRPGQTAAPAAAPARRRARIWIAAAIAVMLAAGAGTYIGISQAQQSTYEASLRPVGIPATISTAMANLMQLAAAPGQAAPGFTLTDQHGHTLSLAAFHGKAVVLEFMDPHCTDICPIISAEFVDAYHDLGAAARNVVFLAVNVNPYHNKVTDMAAYSGEHGLTAIPSWHFFTGPVPALERVWASYNVLVQARNPNADVVHTSTVYFISPSGRESFEASPSDDHTASGTAYLPAGQVSEWGQGIALVVRHLR